MKLTRKLAIIAAVAALALASCSSDDGDDASGSTTTANATATTLSAGDQAIKDGESETTTTEAANDTSSVPDSTVPATTGAQPADYILDYGSDAGLDALADSCYAGSAVDCDELYRTSPVDDDQGSPTYEGYGGTCGDRVPFQRPSDCVNRI